MRNTTKKKIAPIVMTVLVIVYIAPVMWIVLDATRFLDKENISLLFPMLCWLLAGGAVIVGVLRAMRERLREIDRGEEEDAKKY